LVRGIREYANQEIDKRCGKKGSDPAVVIEEIMKEMDIRILIDSFHDDREWNVIENP